MINFTEFSGQISYSSIIKISKRSVANKLVRQLNNSDHGHLSGAKVLVKKVKGVTVSGPGNSYIHVIGSILHKDGTTDRIDLAINFDEAVKEAPGYLPN